MFLGMHGSQEMVSDLLELKLQGLWATQSECWEQIWVFCKNDKDSSHWAIPPAPMSKKTLVSPAVILEYPGR